MVRNRALRQNPVVRLVGGVIIGSGLFLAGCTATSPMSSPSPLQPTSTPTTTQPSPGATTVPVEAELVAINLAPIERAEATIIDGRAALDITYAASTGTCGLLSRVEVEETATEVIVGVFVGMLPDEPGKPMKGCPDLGLLYHTVVALREPLGDRVIRDRRPQS